MNPGRQFALLLLAAFAARAQTDIHNLRIIPDPTHTTVGAAEFWNQAQTYSIKLVSPNTLSALSKITLPVPTGTPGCVKDSTGAGVLVITTCNSGVPPPLYISGGNLGIGNTPGSFLLDVFGAENLHGNLSVSADSAYNMFGPSLAPVVIYTHAFSADNNVLLTGLVAQGLSGCPPCTWDISGGGAGGFTSGAAYFQDVTSRYVFNSIADVPLTGTVNVSGASPNIVTIVTGGPFDLSLAGGQILICPGGTCTASNGTLYLICSSSQPGCPVQPTPTTLALVSGPGVLTGAAFSYQANAFQTSQGTMYFTGDGFGYVQNMVVTDGFTSYGAGSISGTVTCVSTLCTWQSGGLYNPSMNGGYVVIGGTQYIVAAAGYLTNTQFTLTAPCAGTCTAAALAYTANPFQLSNHSYFVDPNGNVVAASDHIDGAPGTHRTLYFTTAGQKRWTLDVDNTAESGSNAGSNLLLSNYSDSGTFISNVLSIARATGIATFPNNVIFSGNINVGSCTGCGGVTGSGTTNTIPIWTSSTAIGNSPITLSGGILYSSDPFSDTGGAMFIDKPAGNHRVLHFDTSGADRWTLDVDNTAESGSNAGSNLLLSNYNDAGTFISNVLSITRATGIATWANAVNFTGGINVGAGSPLSINTSGTITTSGGVSAAAVSASGNVVASGDLHGTNLVINGIWGFGSLGGVNAASYAAGGVAGVSGPTCTLFANGICTHL